MTALGARILVLLEEEPGLQVNEIRARVNAPERTVKWTLRRLRESGLVVSREHLKDMRCRRYYVKKTAPS